MDLTTKFQKNIKYSKEDIITFKKGLLGFKDLKEFVLLDLEENEKFKLLQSIEDENIGFVVICPFHFAKDYEINLNEDTINILNINSQDEVLILTTVTLDSEVLNITTNLRAPIVINIKEKLGEQIITTNDSHKIKHYLFRGDK